MSDKGGRILGEELYSKFRNARAVFAEVGNGFSHSGPGNLRFSHSRVTCRLVVLFFLGAASWVSPALAGVNLVMRGSDYSQTDANTNETILTPANVNSNLFGILAVRRVDGKPYAQPLIVTGVAVPGVGVRDLLLVATEHDSVYAFDAADTSPGAQPFWQASFINPAAGVTPVLPRDVYAFNVSPEIGISGTPFVDLPSGTLFVVAKTKENGPSGTTFANRLHALDIGTGFERPGSPVLLTADVPGTGYIGSGNGIVSFNQLTQMNRAGLTFIRNAAHPNGVVYVAFGSHNDSGFYHGWVLGIDAGTLSIVHSLNITPNGSSGSVWMSGVAPAADQGGNLYVVTGNGSFDASQKNFGDSILKLDTSGPNLAISDYFTPFDQNDMSLYDKDLGSGGLLLLPDSAGSARHPHLAVVSGKTGTIYLVDRDNLGHYNPLGDSQIVQSLPLAVGDSYGGIWGGPAYFDGCIYFQGNDDYLKAFAIQNGQLSLSPIMRTRIGFGYPGATPFISANGLNNAVVWVIEHPSVAADPANGAVLHAYDARNLAVELYNSNQAGTRDMPGAFIAFNPPVVANGKVYLAVSNAVVVYGLLTKAATPTLAPAGGLFVKSVDVTLGGTTPTAQLRYTTDGSVPVASSTLYTGTATFTNSVVVQVRAFVPGMAGSDVVAAKYTIAAAAAGHGSGLQGSFWSNNVAGATGPPALSRLDAPIVFSDWTAAGPDPAIGPSNYIVRWAGTVQPQFNEAYTFTVAADGGIRLSINGQPLIDSWFAQPAGEHSGKIALKAGQRYSIQLDYSHGSGDAIISLDWSSASVAREHVPTSQLYPPNLPPSIALTLPAPGTSVYGPASILLSASASDTDGSVTNVTFFQDGKAVASFANPPYNFTLTGVGTGSHTFYVVAKDDLGAVSSSAASVVSVGLGSGAPFGLDSRANLPAYLNFPQGAGLNLPPLISQTGAFTDPANLTPVTGIIPYAINVPFWSDGAMKQRWMAIPNDGGPLTPDRQIAFSQDGDWSFPVGTVFIKHFDILTNENDPQSLRRLETRFLVNLGGGIVYGSAYKWRPDHLDADLVTSGLAEDLLIQTTAGVRTQRWYYPGPSDCVVCHNPAASGILGPSKTRQLNGNFTYPSTGTTDNQLRTLNHLGLLYPPIDEAALPSFSRVAQIGDPNASIEWQARSFLDVNCAYCHQPAGLWSQYDARITTPLAAANIISRAGLGGLSPVAPGDPAHSSIYLRVNTVNPLAKMPPLGRNEIDGAAADTLAAWINSMVNFAPVLPSVGPQTIGEWTTLAVTNTATELSLNSKLSYALLSAPDGAVIGPGGVISWTPRQNQSPSTNTFVTVATATDPMDVANPVLTSTNRFIVIVKEVNVAPILPEIGIQTAGQWLGLTVTNAAAAPNSRARISYALLDPPAGAAIDANGVVTWPAPRSQTPGNYIITSVAASADALDLANPILRATNRFTVVLKEANVAPWWNAAIGAQSVRELTLLTVACPAQQARLHAKAAYALNNPPAGASIDDNGIFSWTPSQSQSPSTNVIAVVAISADPYDPVHPVLKATNYFSVVVKEVNAAPLLPVIGLQTVNELAALTVTNTAAEPNIHAAVAYTLAGAPRGAVIGPDGIISWTPGLDQGPSTNIITTVATAIDAFDPANPVLKSTNRFTVLVKEVNVAPILPKIGVQTAGQWQTVKVTNTAAEPNSHARVSYALLNPPAGAVIDTNGIFSWPAVRAQAPGTNIVTVVASATDVLDAINPVLKATNHFTVVLKESNVAPWWDTPIGDRKVNELASLTVTCTAKAAWIHAQVTYVLISPPTGASIDGNGIFSWTPGQSQGPSTNLIAVVAVSADPYDPVNPRLMATNRFRVVVKEVNAAPLLPVIGLQTVSELTALTVTNTATGLNPHASVTYALAGAPAGAVIGPGGVISWTPGQNQSPSTNIITTVAAAADALDTSNPVLTATNHFTVVVREVNAAPVLPEIPVQTAVQWRTLTVTNTASESNRHAQVNYTLLAPPPGASIDTNGLFSWKPKLEQVPGTNIITTVAAAVDPLDLANPVLKATNRFTVVLNEANVMPWWSPAIGDQKVTALALLTVVCTAQEPGIHAKLAYALVMPPDGAAIDANGLFSWTPGQSQSQSTNYIVLVATATDPYDPVNPVLMATNRFRVVVTAPKHDLKAGESRWIARITHQALMSNSFQMEVEAAAGITYILQASETLEPGDWKDIQVLKADASPFPMADTNASAFPGRFYRVRIAPAEGIVK